MSEFQVHVKYVDRIVDMDLIEPGDCSVISLINDTKKELINTSRSLSSNSFWFPNIQFPEDAPAGLLGFNQQNIVEDVATDGSDGNVGSAVDDDY
ncbi:hypothetical protein Q3G72_014263 [Acer saccharum]|nr:hypothetical protein Q3G72_014263 [Acer saccharum]